MTRQASPWNPKQGQGLSRRAFVKRMGLGAAAVAGCALLEGAQAGASERRQSRAASGRHKRSRRRADRPDPLQRLPSLCAGVQGSERPATAGGCPDEAGQRCIVVCGHTAAGGRQRQLCQAPVHALSAPGLRVGVHGRRAAQDGAGAGGLRLQPSASAAGTASMPARLACRHMSGTTCWGLIRKCEMCFEPRDRRTAAGVRGRLPQRGAAVWQAQRAAGAGQGADRVRPRTVISTTSMASTR